MKKVFHLSIGLLAAVFLFIWLGLPSCRQGGEKAQEKTLERAIEQGGGGNADVDVDNQKITIESEEGKMQINTADNQWPSDAPPEVPKVTAGEIAGTTTSESARGRNWSIRFTGIGIEELDRYGALLKDNGFIKTSTMKAPKGGMVSGQKGNIGVIFTVSEKVSSLIITVEQE